MNDKYIEYALRTWYAKDSPLHFDQLHPALGLAGEGGELLDIFKKDKFKPDWNWWNCKHCFEKEHTYECITSDLIKPVTFYTPILLDELGDYSYYLRILHYQNKMDFTEPYFLDIEPLDALIGMAQSAMFNLCQVRKYGKSSPLQLNSCYRHMMLFLKLIDVELETVLELNWLKLKEGDNHGWKDA